MVQRPRPRPRRRVDEATSAREAPPERRAYPPQNPRCRPKPPPRWRSRARKPRARGAMPARRCEYLVESGNKRAPVGLVHPVVARGPQVFRMAARQRRKHQRRAGQVVDGVGAAVLVRKRRARPAGDSSKSGIMIKRKTGMRHRAHRPHPPPSRATAVSPPRSAGATLSGCPSRRAARSACPRWTCAGMPAGQPPRYRRRWRRRCFKPPCDRYPVDLPDADRRTATPRPPRCAPSPAIRDCARPADAASLFLRYLMRSASLSPPRSCLRSPAPAPGVESAPRFQVPAGTCTRIIFAP